MGNPLSSGAASATPADALEFPTLAVDVRSGTTANLPISAPAGFLITITCIDVYFPNFPSGGGWLEVGRGSGGIPFYVWTPGGAQVSSDYWRGAITDPPSESVLYFNSVTGEFVVNVSGYIRPSRLITI